MKFYKTELEMITMEETQLFIPMTMINIAQKLYGENNQDFTCSIDCMWSLVTKGKINLTKTKRNELVALFEQYLGKENLTWEDDIQFDYFELDENYIVLNIQDINNIFIEEKRLDKIANKLAITLDVHSYMDGSCVYLSKEELVMEVSPQHESRIDMNNSKTWFMTANHKNLEIIASKFVAFPTMETLLTKRHNEDKNDYTKPLMAEVNFNKYVKELEELGIICKVNTKYGSHGNKAVYCRVEHKEVCEALYERLDELKQMAKKHKNNEIEEEEIPVEKVSFKDVVTKKQEVSKRPRPKFN